MLNTPASRRLADYRAKAADWRVKVPGSSRYHDWRAHVRPITRNNGGSWQSLESMREHRNSDRAYFCDNWPAGIREIGDAHKVAELSHTGWYADNFQDDLVKGFVLQLPARNRECRYIPGTYRTNCDGVTIYPTDVYDNDRDCAYAADRIAEIEAERCREDDAKFQAEQQTEELRNRIVDIRSEARALIREMKAVRSVTEAIEVPTLCAAIRADIAALRRESQKAYKRIAKLADNYWYAVES